MRTQQEIEEKLKEHKKDAQYFQEILIDDPQDSETQEWLTDIEAKIDIIEWVLRR